MATKDSGSKHDNKSSNQGNRGGSKENNPGNFANDRERASEAGRKGGEK